MNKFSNITTNRIFFSLVGLVVLCLAAGGGYFLGFKRGSSQVVPPGITPIQKEALAGKDSKLVKNLAVTKRVAGFLTEKNEDRWTLVLDGEEETFQIFPEAQYFKLEPRPDNPEIKDWTPLGREAEDDIKIGDWVEANLYGTIEDKELQAVAIAYESKNR